MADNNVDDILIPREQAMLADEKIPASPVEKPAEAPVAKESIKENEEVPPIIDETPIESPPVEKPIENEVTPDSPIDEYGNPIEKPKMYSEEEVQAMIRDRLKRGHRQEQSNAREINQAAKDFKADPNSEETWEDQLNQFIDRKLDSREKEIREKQWKEREESLQAEFESKFTTGMNRYRDFHQVVANKPVTNEMMLATRNFNDPAAFIYGAAKLHPQELERIARIGDKFTQATEIGRLHERMIKDQRKLSKAPAPIEPIKGDMVNKTPNNQPSLEDRIHSYAKQKRR